MEDGRIKLGLGNVGLAVPMKFPWGDVKKSIGVIRLEVCGEAKANCLDQELLVQYYKP